METWGMGKRSRAVERGQRREIKMCSLVKCFLVEENAREHLIISACSLFKLGILIPSILLLFLTAINYLNLLSKLNKVQFSTLLGIKALIHNLNILKCSFSVSCLFLSSYSLLFIFWPCDLHFFRAGLLLQLRYDIPCYIRLLQIF